MAKKTLSDKLVECMSASINDEQRLSCKKRFKMARENPKEAKLEDSLSHWTGVQKSIFQTMEGGRRVRVISNPDGSIKEVM